MTKLLLVPVLTGFFAALGDPDAAADDSHHRLVCCAVGVDTNEDNETLLKTPKQVRSILEVGPRLRGGLFLTNLHDLPEPLWARSFPLHAGGRKLTGRRPTPR